MFIRVVIAALLYAPTQAFGAAAVPLFAAAAAGVAGGTVLNSAMKPQAGQPNNHEANSNPQNTTTATYSNQSSPTNNLNVTFAPNFNLGDGSKSYNGNGGPGGQQGSDLNSNTESSSENSAGGYGHGRHKRNGYGSSVLSNGTLGVATVVSLGAAAAYYVLRPANPENVLVSPHSWHNWKRSEIPTNELALMAPEQVGEMMAGDVLFGMKRSAVGGRAQDAIPEIIKTIDQELQELKRTQKKTGLVQSLCLGWLFGIDQEIVAATKMAIERDEVLLGQLSKWYATDLSLRTCNRAELRS